MPTILTLLAILTYTLVALETYKLYAVRCEVELIEE